MAFLVGTTSSSPAVDGQLQVVGLGRGESMEGLYEADKGMD